ncbi:MAG: heparinase II/III-family protein, partial [Clostridia bacterium]
NDKLSFELCINGKDVIVDPGTYVYTPNPEQRNKFRSTDYHNTVCIDGQEQNDFAKDSLFSMKNNTKTECLKWETNNDVDIFIGRHKGYERFEYPIMHRRKIKFYKKENKIEINDTFRGDGQHNLEWNLYIKDKNNINYILDKKINWHNEATDISPNYGCKISVEKINGKYFGDLNNNFFQTISW